jgi:STE24 endopeptidase
MFVATLRIALASCMLAAAASGVEAQFTGTSPVLATPPAAAQGANGHLDPEAATKAYLATLPADKKAKSDAYFEGGYWLILWDFLVSATVFLILLATGLSARMRSVAERLTTSTTLQSAIYWVQFIVVVSVIQLPWSIYEGYVREHTYGLSNLSFGAWLGEQVKGLVIALVLGAILVAVLYAIVRR